MLKFRIWLLIAAVLMVMPLNLNVEVASAASYSYSGTLSNGYPTNVNDQSSVSYSIPVTAGDTLTINLSYSGKSTCGASILMLNAQGGSIGNGFWLYSVDSNFSGNFTDSYQMQPTMDVSLGMLVGCTHSPLFHRVTLDYVLEITVGTPSTPVLSDPIIAAEEAAGLQRVQDNALPVVIYTPTPANPDRFIDIRDLEGNPLLHISADDRAALPDFPTENLLIASTPDGFISAYKLTTGEYQVNVGPLPDGKVHVVIFDGIPRTHTYGYTWNMTDTAP